MKIEFEYLLNNEVSLYDNIKQKVISSKEKLLQINNENNQKMKSN